MSKQTSFTSLLVPTDFSDASRVAFEWAAATLSGQDAVIILQHVLDEAMIQLLEDYDFGEKSSVIDRIRKQALEDLEAFVATVPTEVQVDPLVSVGTPFLEIVRKAEDFAVDAIVMSKVGLRGGFQTLLFGSTAEHVMRASGRPVIVLPDKTSPL